MVSAFSLACGNRATNQAPKQVAAAQPTPTPLVIPVSDGFDYPFGGDADQATRKRDMSGWYNAQDFGDNDHLGEDWNAATGGNTDCGMPVYAASKGTIVFAQDAGAGWGNVLILRHRLPDGALVETLYGHLQSFAKTSGEVNRRERIGSIGDGGGAYLCHLHFELRLSNCPAWGQAGAGYSSNRTGWLDPSDFIDANRFFKDSQRAANFNPFASTFARVLNSQREVYRTLLLAALYR